MKFSAVLACTMALGSHAAALPVREPSGRLALRAVVCSPPSAVLLKPTNVAPANIVSASHTISSCHPRRRRSRARLTLAPQRRAHHPRPSPPVVLNRTPSASITHLAATTKWPSPLRTFATAPHQHSFPRWHRIKPLHPSLAKKRAGECDIGASFVSLRLTTHAESGSDSRISGTAVAGDAHNNLVDLDRVLDHDHHCLPVAQDTGSIKSRLAR